MYGIIFVTPKLTTVKQIFLLKAIFNKFFFLIVSITFIGRPELVKLVCYPAEIEVVLTCQTYWRKGNIKVSIPRIDVCLEYGYCKFFKGLIFYPKLENIS